MVNENLAALRSGHGDAFREIAAEYMPLIESQVSKFKGSASSDAECDDMRQEAMIALYRAAQSYEPECEKVTFGLYAKICIRNRLISYLRKNPYLDFESAEIIPCDKDPEQDFIDRESYERLESFINVHLTDYEKSVFNLYLMNKSYAEIARSLGKDEKSVGNALARIKRKLSVRLM